MTRARQHLTVATFGMANQSSDLRQFVIQVKRGAEPPLTNNSLLNLSDETIKRIFKGRSPISIEPVVIRDDGKIEVQINKFGVQISIKEDKDGVTVHANNEKI